MVWIRIPGQIQEVFLFFFTFFTIESFSNIFLDFSENNLWILMKKNLIMKTIVIYSLL